MRTVRAKSGWLKSMPPGQSCQGGSRRPGGGGAVQAGKSWHFVGWIGDEPAGYASMPATVRLSATELLTAIRRRDESRKWIETYRSPRTARRTTVNNQLRNEPRRRSCRLARISHSWDCARPPELA
jgi:hypothetical protein